MPIETEQDAKLLARLIVGEADNQPIEGQAAVAWVAVNRVAAAKKNPALVKLFGLTLEEVILKPKQFSCFNQEHPRRAYLLGSSILESREGRLALWIAEGVLNNRIPDYSKQADHYLTHGARARVKWDDEAKLTAIINDHAFFRLYA